MVGCSQVMRELEALGTVRATRTARGFNAEPADGHGFGLELVRDQSEFTVLFLGDHQHFETEGEALRFLVYLLSDRCRLVEVSRGRRTYKWVVESSESGGWRPWLTMGTCLLFPFWRSRQQRIHQNHAVADPESVLAAT